MKKIVLLAALSACAPTLSAESTAPPGRVARLDEIRGFWGVKGYKVELSQGAALAVSCTQNGPCAHLVATTDDAAIAEVRPASLGAMRPQSWTNSQPAAAVVLIGKSPGATTLHLRGADGSRDVSVTIVSSTRR